MADFVLSLNTKTKKSDGYTLLELIVVMVILSISLYFFMPSLKKPSNMKAVARRVIAISGHLRSMAVRSQEKQSLDYHANGFSAGVSKKTETEMLDEEESAKQSIPLPDNVSLEVSYPNGDVKSSGTITFYPTGYADPAAIHLSKDGYDYLTLVVEPFLSKIRIYEEYWEFPQR
ncbi:protein containing Prepilin-type cleavage/methylation [Candidatus Magnetomorum sp. HK-1]|nr:protein containing Prepilin-type cleavage/methylation [Candidatus Magnetomorum sp. HK-1]